MSAAPEKAVEAPKKKKGKLPIILVAVLVLGGGGYFMKSQGAKKEVKKEPEIKLEAPESLGPVFLIRMSDGRTFLSLDVSIQKEKEAGAAAKKEEGGSKTGDPILRDAVNMVLLDTNPKDMGNLEGIANLKERLAWSINKVLVSQKASTEPAKEEKETSKKKKKKKKDEPEAPDTFAHVPKEDRDHPDWDSDEGPVHLIYFSNLTTQFQ